MTKELENALFAETQAKQALQQEIEQLRSEIESLKKVSQSKPIGFIVEGIINGERISKAFFFEIEEARLTASEFAKHYETVNTRPVYFILQHQIGVNNENSNI